jgi:hypothetical protein
MPEKDAERLQQVEGELARLREQHELLASAMATINGYERVAVVVEHGFTDLAEQLAPLRELRPIRTGTPLTSVLLLITLFMYLWQRLGWMGNDHTHRSPPHEHLDVPPHDHDA